MAWGTGASSRTSTAAHKARARRVLKRDQFQCQLQGPQCVGIATQCDHIRNVKSFRYPELAERDDNCQAVCEPCHRNKTLQESVEARNRKRSRLKLPQGPHPGAQRG